MILIADSSALITLATVDKLWILDEIFGVVYIPQAVYDELTIDNKAESKILNEYCKDKIYKINQELYFNIILGAGESEAIILYKELNANFLLCDDKKAKKYAQSLDINVIGSLGLLLKAKEKGLITDISSLIEKLKQSSIYIDNKVYQLVLELAKE